MKTFVLTLLLSAFVFIVVHDYVISHVDNDTQTELVYLESGHIDTEMLCDISKLHHHLHESFIGTAYFGEFLLNDTVCKTFVQNYTPTFTPFDLSHTLYRPPIA